MPPPESEIIKYKLPVTCFHGRPFANRWSDEWKTAYNDLLRSADLVVNVCNGVFQQLNEWMVDHSNRVIAYFNGSPGSTRNTIECMENYTVEEWFEYANDILTVA